MLYITMTGFTVSISIERTIVRRHDITSDLDIDDDGDDIIPD